MVRGIFIDRVRSGGWGGWVVDTGADVVPAGAGAEVGKGRGGVEGGGGADIGEGRVTIIGAVISIIWMLKK